MSFRPLARPRVAGLFSNPVSLIDHSLDPRRPRGTAWTRSAAFSVIYEGLLGYPEEMANHDKHDADDEDSADTQPAAPITSRFLFVDVAAQRAKQLRRGALARLDRTAVGSGPHKLERVAMEEVRTGVIHYTLPTTHEGTPRGPKG